MLLLNFAHPITAEQMEQVESLTSQKIERLIEIDSQVNHWKPLSSQVQALIDQVPISSSEWQGLPLLINPPSLNFTALALLAELHGRCGYFPPVMRLRPVADCIIPRYEVAEILNLQGIRSKARYRR